MATGEYLPRCGYCLRYAGPHGCSCFLTAQPMHYTMTLAPAKPDRRRRRKSRRPQR